MTTCPTCGAPATATELDPTTPIAWRTYVHEPSPLDQLAAWCQANDRDFDAYRVRNRSDTGYVVQSGEAYGHGSSIQGAAASLYKQVTQ